MSKLGHECPVALLGGPTASGKSAVALLLAERFGAELVSADSMQIYRGLDIGTAKPTPAERERVPHHLIDILEPNEPFSVARYQELAYAAIRQIQARGRPALVCGGTGQYLSALQSGTRFSAEAQADSSLRDALHAEAEERGLDVLYNELLTVDPDAAHEIQPTDRRRILRRLEIYRLTGKNASWHKEQANLGQPPWPVLLFALEMPREMLYQRIDARVLQMVRQGLAEEARQLLNQSPASGATALQAIGYKEWIHYFSGQMTLEQVIERIQQASRNYAKRQMTWLRRMPGIQWVDGQNQPEAVDTIARALMNSGWQQH